MATLQISREDAHKKIEERINKGNQLLEVAVTDSTRLHSARADRRRWHDFNKELLAQLFSDEGYLRSTSGVRIWLWCRWDIVRLASRFKIIERVFNEG